MLSAEETAARTPSVMFLPDGSHPPGGRLPDWRSFFYLLVFLLASKERTLGAVLFEALGSILAQF